MAADRGAFICQSQSMNVFIDNPNFGKLTSMHFYGWKKGLKTGMYYLRSKPRTDAISFTIKKDTVFSNTPVNSVIGGYCDLSEECMSCGS